MSSPFPQRVQQLIRENLNEIQDFPEPGVLFRDFSPLLANGPAFREVISLLAEHYRGKIDAVAGLESRGFILGTPLAAELGVSFLMVRKAGKLPQPVIGESYSLEYGTARLEIRPESVKNGSKVLIVDDVLATGGTAAAAHRLLTKAGADVQGLLVMIELLDLHGRSRLGDLALDTIVSF